MSYNEPSSLSRSDMKQEAYIEARNLRAMRDYNDDEPELEQIPNRKDDINIMTDTPQHIANLWRKDNAFQEQSEDISNNAIVDELGWKPSVIKSEVTQDMIDEYKIAQSNPLVIHGKAYKYHPANIVIDLETFVPEAIDIKNPTKALAAKARYAADYAHAQDEIVKFDTIERQRIIDEYNDATAVTTRIALGGAEIKRIDDMTTQDEVRAELNLMGVTHSPRQKLKKLKELAIKHIKTAIPKSRLTAEQLAERYKNDIKGIDGAVDHYKNESANMLARMADIDFRIADSARAENDNRINEARIERENADKLQTMEDELNVLNAGKMNMTRGPVETDEEYKNRLISTGQQSYNDKNIQDQAELVQLSRCKANLKKLLSDDGKISTVANKLTADQRTEYNKFAIPINKKYNETYGFDSDSVTEEEIAQFIREAVATKNFTSPSAVVAAPTAAIPRAKAKIDYYPISHFSKVDLVHLVDANGLPRGTSQAMYDELLANDLIPRKGALGLRLPAVPVAPILPTVPTGPILLPNVAAPLGVGAGISREQFPSLIPFGDYYISPGNLYYKNILSVRGRTGKALNGYKDVKISDRLASIIMKVIRKEHITHHDVGALNEKEQILYDNLLYMSKLHKTHHNTVDKSVEKMKERFAILDGELNAGNDNPLIMKELYQLIFKMAKSNIISMTDAVNYWNQLKKEFF